MPPPPLTNNFASIFRRVVPMSCPENAQDWPMCSRWHYNQETRSIDTDTVGQIVTIILCQPIEI